MSRDVRLPSKQGAPVSSQTNILIQHDLSAISSLPPELQDRAMALIEQHSEHIHTIDNEIITLEKNEQAQRKNLHKHTFIINYCMLGMYFLILFGVIASFIFFAYTGASIYYSLCSLLVSIMMLTPSIIRSLRGKDKGKDAM